jgi:hypothetical protein
VASLASNETGRRLRLTAFRPNRSTYRNPAGCDRAGRTMRKNIATGEVPFRRSYPRGNHCPHRGRRQ